MMPGPPPEVTTKRLAAGLEIFGPLGEEEGEAASVLRIVRHFVGSFRAADAELGGGALFDVGGTSGLLFFGCGLAGAGVFEELEVSVGLRRERGNGQSQKRPTVS